MLAGSDYEAVAPASLGLRLEVDETGDSYAANALLKAQAYAAASGLPVLADDSGLEVDALAGQPGIRSARYGGPGLTDEQRVALLMDRLATVPSAARTARFRCALALQEPGGRLWQADGTVEGVITTEPRGENGFGYDPIFLLPELGRTAAELTEEEKNRLSHRARALAALLALLQKEPL